MVMHQDLNQAQIGSKVPASELDAVANVRAAHSITSLASWRGAGCLRLALVTGMKRAIGHAADALDTQFSRWAAS